MRRLTIGIILGLVIFILFVVLCTFIRRPYERVLLVRFGTPIKEEQQFRIMYNWYFKLPTDSIIRVDTRLHLHQGILQEVVLTERGTISVQPFAIWRIVDPDLFYRTINADDNEAEKRLEDRLQGLIKGELSKHSLDDLFNPDEKKVITSQIEDQVAREATNGSAGSKMAGMRDMGIEVAEVGFSRVGFPPNTAQFVYTRMVEELSRKASGYDAKGRAEGERIRAEGEATASALRADAAREAARIRGLGDAKGLRAIASMQATAEDREFYEYWKSLDFLENSLTKNTIFVLSSSSSWLRSLMREPAIITRVAPSAPAEASTIVENPARPASEPPHTNGGR